jgi:hypothetical protein
MSMFLSGGEVLLTIANVMLSGADSVPAHLLGAHAGKTDVFSWDGDKFVPYLNLPTTQGYANIVLELPCSEISVDGLACADRIKDRLLLVAQGEGSGMQTIVFNSFNGTREATHLVVQMSTPAAAPSEEGVRLKGKREKVIEELKPGLAVCLRWRIPRRKRKNEEEETVFLRQEGGGDSGLKRTRK